MKKLLFLITIMVSGSALLAQNKIKVGVRTGLNFPSLQQRNQFSPGDYKVSTKLLLGLYSEFKIGKYILQPGLMYSVKGNKATQQDNTISLGYPVPYTIERNMNISYLEVPINLLYNKPVAMGTFYAGGGPYVAFGLNGRIRSKDKRSTYINRASVEPVTFGSNSGDVKPSDFGLNLLTGIKVKNFADVGVSYGFGLSNISNNTAYKSYNRVVALHIGYMF